MEEKEELRTSDPLWYNIKLRHPGRRGGIGLPFAPKKLNKLGIWEVGNLINEEGKAMTIKEALQKGMPSSAMMELGAITAIVMKIRREGWERQIRPWRFREDWIDPQLVLGKANLRNEEFTQRKVLEAKAKSRPLIKTKRLA